MRAIDDGDFDPRARLPLERDAAAFRRPRRLDRTLYGGVV
jgi:hypothetical protein